MSALDPVTLAVLAGRLEQIADEMDATLFRAAFNPIIAEAHDASHGLYHPETGDTLVQGKTGLPIFVGVMAFAVRTVIEKAARDGDLAEGDVYAFNDAHAGGTHLSDMRLVRPLFHEGRLFCWLASVGHWHDLGGAAPGNYNPEATDAFQEAFILPPVKLVRAGETQADILDIVMRNTRLPVSARGDLEGQLGALDLGARRLAALLEEYGAGTVRAACEALTARAETLLRAELAALPDGAWTAEDMLDNDGVEDAPLPVRLRLAIEGERMTLDFTGTAPACAGPVNIGRSTAIACCYVAIKHLFPDLPANAGVLAPIDFTIPEGSLLAAEHPKPTGGYTETILRMIDVIFSAFAKAAPGRSNGNAYGTINALSLSGEHDGRRWVMFSFYGGGLGGNPEGDGLNHGNAPISTATIPPVEVLEAAYPVRFTQWALRPDSGGPGRHRGGLGAIYEIELLSDSARGFLFGERGLSGPKGVAGGGEGARTRFAWRGEDGDAWRTPPMVSKMVGMRLSRGARLRLETPGGGGYGPAAERGAKAVDRDLRLGYVTPEAARRDEGRRG